MIPLAHSARNEKPPQTYRDHVSGVIDSANNNVRGIIPFVAKEKTSGYLHIITDAAAYHDLGKLAQENQDVLSGKIKLSRLPIEHRDAGVKLLIATTFESPSATLIYAHHRPGLPNIIEQKTQAKPFRFPDAISDSEQHMNEYLKQHIKQIGSIPLNIPVSKLSAMEYRILLSCLVDADYSNTSDEQLTRPDPKWKERLFALDCYVHKLREKSNDQNSDRNQLRKKLYDFCRNADVYETLEYCDSPVGTGKTTAVMAHMLKKAQENNLRHIIVVLPYTNIISQTVNVFRKALVLEGEKPEAIIAEHHHQADFDSIELRHLASTWTAPIIVTTAVQFFETIASNIPSKLRKLHQLPGSGIIIDESHAALPLTLMLPAWKWITELTKNWSCNICLCSGTSFKFWESTVFSNIFHDSVVPLLSDMLSTQLGNFERNRIILNANAADIPHFTNIKILIDSFNKYHGSRLIVLNTVRSAAFLSDRMRKFGYDVLHLSTALTPSDREKVITEIEFRLDPKNKYLADWSLVATSCIECGMDFSFHYGFCELRSLQSFLQLSGRISRNGEFKDASLICFSAVIDGFGSNPSFEVTKNVFKKQIAAGSLSYRSVTRVITESFDMECNEIGGLSDEICRCENKRAFVDVADKFKIIPDNTITVVADLKIVAKLHSGIEVSANELQRGSVSLRKIIQKKLKLQEMELPYLTEEQYDDFLGYMKSLI